MLARTAFALVLVASGAQAAAFDDLKQDLAECLRFEMAGAGSRKPAADRAIGRCAPQIAMLDRADGRRLHSDRGLSPSTWSVIEGVFGRGARGRFARYLD